MGFGDTAKRLQTIAETAEKLYTRINDLREQLQALRQQVDETSEQVDHIERDMGDQRALLVALAEREGIDAESVLADAATDDTALESGNRNTTGTENDPTENAVSGDATTAGVATNDDGTAVTSEATGDTRDGE